MDTSISSIIPENNFDSSINYISGLSNLNENLQFHWLIYRIDNIKDGKHYIGQHGTYDPMDGYMGSGKYLLRAQKIYDLSNFHKTILFDFSTFDEMNSKEKELVQLSNCYPIDQNSYNLKEGGRDGCLSEESIRKSNETRKRNNTVPCGSKNPMYGKDWRENKSDYEIYIHNKKISDFQKGNTRFKDVKRDDPEKYRMWCKNISNGKTGKMCGKDHPMYGKNPLQNLSEEQMIERSRKISIGNKKAWENFDDDKKREIINKRKQTLELKTEEEKNEEHINRSLSVSGKNNGMYGKHHSEEAKKKMSEQRRGENNPMFGHKCTEYMTKEEQEIYINKLKANWKNMTDEKKQEVIEKRRKSMQGKKWYHNVECTIEQMFNPSKDVIPYNYVLGRIPKKR